MLDDASRIAQTTDQLIEQTLAGLRHRREIEGCLQRTLPFAEEDGSVGTGGRFQRQQMGRREGTPQTLGLVFLRRDNSGTWSRK
ncbi:unnamed protein product [Chondrus crispus]|uniref:Uncharacterized protein n=1 Tax=Chondrus crispus TaxID=2769 RepID=R7QQR7_CHOCR|nr:unnamed protein product [Chondrus crispus]CDF40464.1 unnamed protein product [Chondrus crispus]|eukprot:XP_005710758.1 unnamed protein product [Chondrus crispus]